MRFYFQGQCFIANEVIEMMSATTDMPSAVQPRISAAAFWRRFSSISQRIQSPELGVQPDQWCANASSDNARNCAAVNVGLDDMLSASDLRKIRGRWEKSGWSRAAANEADLTDIGRMLAIDLPKLLKYAESNT